MQSRTGIEVQLHPASLGTQAPPAYPSTFSRQVFSSTVQDRNIPIVSSRMEVENKERKSKSYLPSVPQQILLEIATVHFQFYCIIQALVTDNMGTREAGNRVVISCGHEGFHKLCSTHKGTEESRPLGKSSFRSLAAARKGNCSTFRPMTADKIAATLDRNIRKVWPCWAPYKSKILMSPTRPFPYGCALCHRTPNNTFTV